MKIPSLRTFRELLAVQYAYMNAYRAEIFLWMLTGILPFILMGLWMEIARQGQVGWRPVDFARYFFVVFLVRQFTVTWVIWDFEASVVEGRLSHHLLRPMDPVWWFLSAHLGERLSRLPFLLLICALFFLLYPAARFVPPVSHILLFSFLVLLAFALRFLAQYTLALLAFWMERASSLEGLWQIFYLFLSGTVVPLEFFPRMLRQIIFWTPFPYVVDVPARALLQGEVSLEALAALSAWILGFGVLNRLLWRWGIRQYSAMGA